MFVLQNWFFSFKVNVSLIFKINHISYWLILTIFFSLLRFSSFMTGLFVLCYRFLFLFWCAPVGRSPLLIVGLYYYVLAYLCGLEKDHCRSTLGKFLQGILFSFLVGYMQQAMQGKDHGMLSIGVLMLSIGVFVKGNSFRQEEQELYDLNGPSSVESS